MPAALRPREQPTEVQRAIRAWNLLGGLDWTGLEIVAEILGEHDIETLVEMLALIQRNPEWTAENGDPAAIS